MCLLQRKLGSTSQDYKMLQLLIGEIFLIDVLKCGEGFLKVELTDAMKKVNSWL